MKHLSLAAVLSSSLILMGPPAQATAIWTVVDAQQTVYFAGHDQAQLSTIVGGSSYVPANYSGDLSDADTLPTALDITGLGPVISISAGGNWTHGPCCAPTGPEGKGVSELSHPQYGIFGISLLTADLNMLVGVFLDNSLPSLGVTPASLSTVGGDDMTMPLLSQSFAIGTGLSNIIVPVGATRLFLGMHDGFEWTNNTGSVDVHIESVPEPATLVITGLGLVGLGFSRRRKSQ